MGVRSTVTGKGTNGELTLVTQASVYETIKTQYYVDGILSTHRTLEEQNKQDSKQRALLEDVTAQLTGSKAYQEQFRAAEEELEGSKEASELRGNKDGTPTEWDDDIDEEDLKMPVKEEATESGKIKK